jgi:hypothetical protein
MPPLRAPGVEFLVPSSKKNMFDFYSSLYSEHRNFILLRNYIWPEGRILNISLAFSLAALARLAKGWQSASSGLHVDLKTSHY